MSEDVTATDHPKIVRLVTTPPAYSQMNARITRLASELHVSGSDDLKLLLKTIVPEYTPQVAALPPEERHREPSCVLLL